MSENSVSKGYNILKWGTLITALHINIMIPIGKLMVGVQIIPAFIGYILIAMAINGMNKKGGKRYFDGLGRQSWYLLAMSVIQFAIGVIFGYGTVTGFDTMLTPTVILVVFLYELLLYSDVLNMTVRLYKDNNEIKSADKLRKDRITFIKMGLGLAVLHALTMVPAFADKPFLPELLNYTSITLTLLFKLWFSLIIQNVARKNMEFKSE